MRLPGAAQMVSMALLVYSAHHSNKTRCICMMKTELASKLVTVTSVSVARGKPLMLTCSGV